MAKLFDNPVALIALILVIVLLFGAKRLPDVARSVGSSLKIFKKEVKDLRQDDDGDGPVASGSQGSTGRQDSAASSDGPAEPADDEPGANRGSTSGQGPVGPPSS